MRREAGHDLPVPKQPLDRLIEGRGSRGVYGAGLHKALEVLEIGLVGGQRSRVASGEEGVEEVDTIRELAAWHRVRRG